MTAEVSVISFTLNGKQVSAPVMPHHSLVEFLRKEFGLFGARESCGQGLCGCCTVVVNGAPVSACLYLAAQVDGAEVSTVEALAEGGQLSCVQQAFVECGAFQCGFCTPGFVMMSTQLLERNPNPSDDEIRDYLSGNLCRCATYPEILRAVKTAAEKRAACKPGESCASGA